MNLAPIVLFTYDRLWHTKQTVEALQNNLYAEESNLFIFSDGPKTDKDEPKVKEVREYLKAIKGFKNIEIIERDKNWGLANNIIDAVTKIVNEYGRIIVLEDDIITSPYFLKYMNEALEMYESEEKVASIHGYVYPLPYPEKLPETFFIRGADCWGWATWKRAWKYFESDGCKLLMKLKERNELDLFDFNGTYLYSKMLRDQVKGKNDSWAIRWYASAFLNDMLTLYPKKSLVKNIGLDNSGTHCELSKAFDVDIIEHINLYKIPIEENKEARRQFEIYFSNNSRFSFRIVWNLFRKRVL
jgi:hypothetical protein